MRFSGMFRATVTLCLAVAACVISRQAKADSYNIYSLYKSSGSIDNIGLTDSGTLTTFSGPSLTYTTFTPPSTYTTSPTLPHLTFDNGSNCALPVSGFSAVNQTICNNGRTVFDGRNSNLLPALYLYEAGTLTQLYVGAADNLLLDAMGDIAFVGDSGSNADTNFLYYDMTSRAAVTPEPSSLALLLTGGMGTAAMLRRRWRKV